MVAVVQTDFARNENGQALGAKPERGEVAAFEAKQDKFKKGKASYFTHLFAKLKAVECVRFVSLTDGLAALFARGANISKRGQRGHERRSKKVGDTKATAKVWLKSERTHAARSSTNKRTCSREKTRSHSDLCPDNNMTNHKIRKY